MFTGMSPADVGTAYGPYLIVCAEFVTNSKKCKENNNLNLALITCVVIVQTYMVGSVSGLFSPCMCDSSVEL